MGKIKLFSARLSFLSLFLLIFGAGFFVMPQSSVGATMNMKMSHQAVATYGYGEHKVLGILINFTNDPSEPFSLDELRNALFNGPKSMAAYYNEASFGQMRFSGDAMGYLTIPYPGSCYLGPEVRKTLLASGVDLTKYDILAIVVTSKLCGMAGGSNGMWFPIEIETGNWVTGQVFSHEYGHIIATGDDYSYSCGSKAIDASSNCAATQYGDPYDTMGHGLYHYNAAHKAIFGWIPPERITTATTNGNYTIYPLEKAAAGPQALVIAKSDTDEDYYFEYRQPYGIDSSLPAALTNGAGANINHLYSAKDTQNSIHVNTTKRLDLTPGDNRLDNSALSDGRSFIDSINGITITQVSHSPESVTLNVTFKDPAACRRAMPSVTITPKSQGAINGHGLDYSAVIKNNDTASCPNSTFTLYSTGPLTGEGSTWNIAMSPSQFQLAPGAAATAKINVVAPSESVGNYPFTVTAADGNYLQHQGSAFATYAINAVIADSAAPAITITSPGNNSVINGIVNVDVRTSDNVGVVKVEYYINGRLVDENTAAPFSYRWQTYGGQYPSGDYYVTAKAFDAAGNSTLAQILVTVNDPKYASSTPSVSITNPANNAVYSSVQTVVISATASDNVGVTKVEFYDGAKLLGTSMSAPYSFAWPITSLDDGSHLLSAVAYDADRNSTASSLANVKIEIPRSESIAPTVKIISPANGSTVTEDYVTIKASASDNVGVVKGELYIDNILAFTSGTPISGNYNWQINLSTGSHVVIAKAYDAAGNSAVATINLTKGGTPSDVTAPVVNITAPNGNSSVSGIAYINANASDNVGVAKVEFYIDNILNSTEFSSPYNYAWDTTALAGPHVITAKAYDAAGNVGISASVTVTVNNSVVTDNAAPIVSLSAPVSGSIYSTAQTIVIKAIASDNVGVAKVEFYDGATLLGADTTSPYSYSWPIVAANNGSHTLTAKAYDAAGNPAVSIAVAVTVNISNPGDTVAPTVGITAPTADSTVNVVTNITAIATDNVSVAKVEFYVDGALLGTDTASPYSYAWNTSASANGTHSLSAKAYDTVGNVGTSAVVNVTVSNAVVTTAPTVSIIAPADGSAVNGTVAISVTTTNKSLTSQYTALYIDGKYVTSAIPRYSSFQYNWNTASYANGPHTIKATIGTAASTAITVTVNNGVAVSRETLDYVAWKIQSIQASLAGIMAQIGN